MGGLRPTRGATRSRLASSSSLRSSCKLQHGHGQRTHCSPQRYACGYLPSGRHLGHPAFLSQSYGTDEHFHRHRCLTPMLRSDIKRGAHAMGFHKSVPERPDAFICRPPQMLEHKCRTPIPVGNRRLHLACCACISLSLIPSIHLPPACCILPDTHCSYSLERYD